jgi:hypothetical protein
MRRISVLGLVLLALLAAACSGPSATSVPPRTVRASFSLTVGTIGVPASNYQVVVTTSGTCWVRATHGTNAVLFADELPAGQTRTFSAKNGKVSVQLGSAQVKVSVQIGGRRVLGWRYTPTTVPTSLNFHSVS